MMEDSVRTSPHRSTSLRFLYRMLRTNAFARTDTCFKMNNVEMEERHDLERHSFKSLGGFPLDGERACLPTERSAIKLTTKDDGVGKQADLVVFNPIFDPTGTGYVWRDDISGYPLDEPTPAIRCPIITTARLSSRLLHHIDQANTDGHIVASEMMPATAAFQQDLKAVYVPIPVYFDRTPSAFLAEQIFNGGGSGYSGGHPKSVFSLGQEHFIQGGTYYYQADFARKLWAAWTQGDVCLPPMLLHPAKYF